MYFINKAIYKQNINNIYIRCAYVVLKESKSNEDERVVKGSGCPLKNERYETSIHSLWNNCFTPPGVDYERTVFDPLGVHLKAYYLQLHSKLFHIHYHLPSLNYIQYLEQILSSVYLQIYIYIHAWGSG